MEFDELKEKAEIEVLWLRRRSGGSAKGTPARSRACPPSR